MRILIIGSSGQLGTELARQLSSQHQVIGIDIVPGAWTHHLMNITDQDAIAAVMKGVDAVIHIASYALPERFAELNQR